MKCNLELLKQNNIPYSFETLLLGAQHNLIDNNDIANYATNYLYNHPKETSPLITELALIDKSTTDVTDMLKNLLMQKFSIKSFDSTIEERKLRFCLLADLASKASNNRQILEKSAEIYAFFNYPPDMENFIYYMPAKDYEPLQHSHKENEQRLINFFYNFLEYEKQNLQN